VLSTGPTQTCLILYSPLDQQKNLSQEMSAPPFDSFSLTDKNYLRSLHRNKYSGGLGRAVSGYQPRPAL
jgi:hypothetical protein